MKTLTTLLALTITMSSFAFTGPGDKKDSKPAPAKESKMAIMKLSNQNYKLYYVPVEAAGEQRVRVNVYNEDGLRIYSKRHVTSEGFAIPYNFAELTPGTYTFEVINADGSAIREVIKHNALVEEVSLVRMEAMVQRVSPETNKFQLLVVKPDQNMVTVRIKNENDIIVHEERVNFEKGFKRVYDLGKVNSEYYTFEVTSGPQSQTLTAE
jgi:hypothetical protein